MEFTTEMIPQGREAWLKLRQTGVGSSDAPAAIGLSKWKSPLELYLEKISEVIEDEPKERLYWGQRLEDIVAKEFELRSGYRATRSSYMYRSKRWPHMTANIDRKIIGAIGRGPGVLECKTANQFAAGDWGPSGTDLVPDAYMVQVQHQLGVTGYDWAVLAVLIGGQDFRTYQIWRNQQAIEDIAALTMDFWNCVKDLTPPTIDFDDPRAKELVKILYPGTNGQTVHLGAESQQYHDRLTVVKAEIKTLESERDTLQARILANMEEAAVGILPNGGAYTRTLQRGGIVPSYVKKDSITLRFTSKVKGQPKED